MKLNVISVWEYETLVVIKRYTYHQTSSYFMYIHSNLNFAVIRSWDLLSYQVAEFLISLSP